MTKKQSTQQYAKDFADKVAQTLIDHIEAGTAPWQKPWEAGHFRDQTHNPITDKPYRGINTLWLSMQGHEDPRWMTYNQAAKAGHQVMKGEKSTQIEYWQWSKDELVVDDNGEVQKDENGHDRTQKVKLDKPRVFYANVFNGSQIEGLEAYVVPELPADGFEPHIQAEKILASLGVPIKHNQGDRAYYVGGSKDEIHLPPKGQFISKEAYYSTALHELGHATGHESRLNRNMAGGFGSQNYAKEELRAEIASFMLNTQLGLGHDPSQHASYVESWVKALKDDPREIFRAAKDADLIQTYLQEPELRQKLEHSAHNIISDKAEEKETMQKRNYIKIEFEDTAGRAEAKALGAKYDRKARSWHIPEGVNPEPLAKFPSHDPLNKPKVDPLVSFRDFLHEKGFAPKGDLIAFDGEWHEVPLAGQKGGKASGSYKVFGDAVQTMVAQNHKTGEQFKITNTGQEVTAADRKVIAEQREQNKAVKEELSQAGKDKKAVQVQSLFRAASWAQNDHPYLDRKGVESFGLKETRDGSLAIPMRNFAGEIRAMQFITPEGGKRYYGQKTGMMHLLDPDKLIRAGKVDQILIAEGYATGATLHQITGKPVAIAFDSDNLKSVAEAIREANPKAEIVIMADNDHKTEIKGEKVNVGIKSATEAAASIGGHVAFPYFKDTELEQGLTDWNDLAKSRGSAANDLINKAANHAQARNKFASKDSMEM